MLTSVAYVFVSTKEMGMGGLMLAVIGFALVGITMWTDAEFQIGDMKAKLSRAEQKVDEVSSELQTASTELEEQHLAVLDLTQRLEVTSSELITLKKDPRLKLNPGLIERFQAIDPAALNRATIPQIQLRSGNSQ